MPKKNNTAEKTKPNLRLVAVSGAPVAEEQPATKKKAPDRPDPDSFRGLRAEVASMSDEDLLYFRAGMQADLDIIEREWRRREEARDLAENQRRRALVVASERLASGQILTSEAGTPLAFSYCGTAWILTAAAAARRGTPHLAGCDVCYAYGKPVPSEMVSADGITVAAAGQSQTGTEFLKVALAMIDGACQRPETLEVGDALELRREPDNEADSNAVAAVTEAGVRVGYLYRPMAAKLAPLLDAGLAVSALVWRTRDKVELALTGAAIDAALLG